MDYAQLRAVLLAFVSQPPSPDGTHRAQLGIGILQRLPDHLRSVIGDRIVVASGRPAMRAAANAALQLDLTGARLNANYQPRLLVHRELLSRLQSDQAFSNNTLTLARRVIREIEKRWTPASPLTVLDAGHDDLPDDFIAAVIRGVSTVGRPTWQRVVQFAARELANARDSSPRLRFNDTLLSTFLQNVPETDRDGARNVMVRWMRAREHGGHLSINNVWNDLVISMHPTS